MKSMVLWSGLFAVTICLAASPQIVCAALTSEQRKELSRIRRDLSRVTATISRKKFDEAEKSIKDIEARIKRVTAAAKLPSNSAIVKALNKSLARQRHALAVKKDPRKAKQQQQAGVSFVKYVAPILNSRCVKCHGDDSLGNLKLNSYAAMRKGGKSGLLVAAGNASRSLLMLRLTAPAKKLRMPKSGKALSPVELRVLALWINQGARFDGEDEDTELADLLKPKKEQPALKGFEPTGKETVSFKKDIAPWMVAFCIRCHSGKKPQGELSLESFDALMRGGKSGRAIVPGKPAESLAYELTGSFDEAKRMPIDRKKLLRRNWDDLGRWIFEGAKYDGGDPKLLLRALNPTQSQMKADELVAFTPAQFDSFREARTAAQWKTAFPQTEPQSATLDDVLIYGNISTERLAEVKDWTAEHFKTLRKLFGLSEDKRIWKGKLTIFVVKNRGDFETFNNRVSKRRVFEESFADINITPTYEDALLVIQDTGDKSDEQTPTLRFSLIAELTNAYLQTSQADYPQWFSLGVSGALASRKTNKRDKYVETLRAAAVESLGQLKKPADVFKDGVFFSSEQAQPVSFTLVEFMLTKGGGENRFAKLIKALNDGGGLNSLRVAYGADPALIARNYLSALKVKRKRNNKK